MRKITLIKYIKEELSECEQMDVLAWAGRDKANELYLARLQNLWISQNIAQERASVSEIAEIMHLLEEKDDIGGNPATYNIKKWVVWGAAASMLLFFSAGFYLLEVKNNASAGQIAENSVEKYINYKNLAPTKVLYTEKGVKAKLLLPDSSVVWLNSDTKIEYPDKFDSLVRNVTISGEAYFDVVKNPSRPMIVKTTKGFSVQVLGTQFNLKAYENDVKSQATLYSGKINLLRESGNRIITTEVLPFQTITINTTDKNTPVKKILKPFPMDDAAWKEGKIIFDETPVEEVVKVLERWHGVSFVVENKDVLKYKITATFHSESIIQIMDLIQMTSLVNYNIVEKQVFLGKKSQLR